MLWRTIKTDHSKGPGVVWTERLCLTIRPVNSNYLSTSPPLRGEETSFKYCNKATLKDQMICTLIKSTWSLKSCPDSIGCVLIRTSTHIYYPGTQNIAKNRCSVKVNSKELVHSELSELSKRKE